MTTKVYTDCAKLMEDASSDRTVIVIGYESPDCGIIFCG